MTDAVRGLRANIVIADDFHIWKPSKRFSFKHIPRIRNRMPGKRARRIARFYDSVIKYNPLSSSNPGPTIDEKDLQPVWIAPEKGQLKRGYKPLRNAECYCKSGKKYKHCHKVDEEVTPRLGWET